MTPTGRCLRPRPIIRSSGLRSAACRSVRGWRRRPEDCAACALVAGVALERRGCCLTSSSRCRACASSRDAAARSCAGSAASRGPSVRLADRFSCACCARSRFAVRESSRLRTGSAADSRGRHGARHARRRSRGRATGGVSGAAGWRRILDHCRVTRASRRGARRASRVGIGGVASIRSRSPRADASSICPRHRSVCG